jgi:hypothetical protein
MGNFIERRIMAQSENPISMNERLRNAPDAIVKGRGGRVSVVVSEGTDGQPYTAHAMHLDQEGQPTFGAIGRNRMDVESILGISFGIRLPKPEGAALQRSAGPMPPGEPIDLNTIQVD